MFLLRCYRNVLWQFRIEIFRTVAKSQYSILLEICPTPNPTLNLPDCVNKCKTDIKMYLLMQPCHFIFLICRFELLCWPVITQDSNRSSSPPKYVSMLRELPNKRTFYENPMLTFKSHSFQISQLFDIVLKSWHDIIQVIVRNYALIIQTLNKICVKRSKICRSCTASSVYLFWKLQ